MRTLFMVAQIASVALTAAFGAPGPALAADGGASTPVPACVHVTSEARYVPYGYDHVVGIRNGCSRAASCSVSTDVNPERQRVEVPAGAAIEVVTFKGSPAQAFVAHASCTLAK